jgi:hypothetical protein
VHHDEHGSADYGSADYGSANYSVSELPRSSIGISRFRELPIPASAHIGNRPSRKHHHHDAHTRTRHLHLHGTYTSARTCVHRRMLPHADAVPRPHG